MATRAVSVVIGAAVAWVVAFAFPITAGADDPDGGHVRAKDLDRSEFPGRPLVDNPYLPLVPGTKLVYVGEVVSDGESTPHRVVTIVTDLRKVIDGVATLVIFERDFSEGEIQESELAFMAQDDDGTVWSFGEYPEEFEDGEFLGAPSTWIAGVDQSRAGILMQARPRLGEPQYSQGRAPSVEFADTAKVVEVGQRICVPAGCFQDVIVIEEFDALDPEGGQQLKHHAPGVGVVAIRPRGGDEPETLDLVSVEHLGPTELAEVRLHALRLEQRAYRVARPVYGTTPPAEQLPQR